MTTYPKIDDPDFYTKINKKYKRFKIPKSKPNFNKICFPRKFELQIQQLFLPNFINFQSPYKGLLMFHRIGAGKTCTAIQISKEFIGKRKILFVVPASLKNNLRNELRSYCGGKYLTQYEQKNLSTLDPKSSEYNEIIKLSNERIDKDYTILSYNKFIDLLKSRELSLENSILFIDEVHNMVSEYGTYYSQLYKIIKKTKDLILILMSATPIFDKPIEIALLMNLLPLKREIPTGHDFMDTFIKIKKTVHGNSYSVKNMDMFKNLIKGYVSYYRGAPPIVFPKTIIKLVKCKMQNYQLSMYKSISNDNVEYSFDEIPQNFYLGKRMVSNIAYPNGKLDGYKSLTEKYLTVDKIKNYSIKFYKIFSRMKKSSGPVFIYSNFKEEGGMKAFIIFLEFYGYLDYTTNGAGRKRYAVWSGDQPDDMKREIQAVFNNPNNKNGSKIKLILGTPSIKEGVSLLRVRQVHIMEPYWNMSRLDQIMGRAIRFCSHKDMEEEEREVIVYIYMAVHPSIKETIDQKIMHIALNKQKINKAFELALKETATDCDIFKNANTDIKNEIVCQI
jgi:superfamily II DNA or RNA helicase